MNPRAVMTWSAALLFAVIIDANPITRTLLLLAGLNVVAAIWPPDTSLLRPLRMIFLGAVIATLISALLDHSGTHLLIRIPPAIPVLGGPLTLEGLTFGAATGVGLAAGLVSILPLAYVLDAADLVDVMPRGLERVGSVLVLSMGLLPRLRRSAVAIVEAQQMRGYKPRKLRDAPDVVVPVVLAAVEDAMLVSSAMEARAFGSGPRTKWAVERWNAASVLVVACATLAVAVAVMSRLAGWDTDWFPFPTLSAPSVEVAGIVIAVLCAVAALVPQHD
jgi:energy-coupling factor transport system permease protein